MKVLTSLNNMIQVLLKSDKTKESYVGLNIPQFLYKEAAILDIHEANLIKYA